MIPDHIARRITEANREPRRTTPEARPVARGDVRRLQNHSAGRLVLVLSVDTVTQTSQITLLHSYTEFATEADVIVTPALSGLPYDVIVETDLRGVVHTREIRDLIATLPDRIVHACFAVPTAFAADDTAFRGPARAGQLDALWDFKIAEGNTIRDLSSAAFEMLTEEAASWQFIFEEIFRAILLPAQDAMQLMLGTLERWELWGDFHASTPDQIDKLDKLGWLERTLWTTKLPEIGGQYFDSLVIPVIEQYRSAWNKQSAAPQLSIGLTELRLA